MELEEFKVGLVERARRLLTVKSLFDLFEKKGADPMQLILHLLPAQRRHLFDVPAGVLVGDWSEEVTRETPKRRWILGKFFAQVRARDKIKEAHYAAAVPVWFQANDLPWILTQEWLSQNEWWLAETETSRSVLTDLIMWSLESLPLVRLPALQQPLKIFYRLGLTTDSLVRLPPAWLTEFVLRVHQVDRIEDTEQFVMDRFPPHILVQCMDTKISWQFLSLVFDAVGTAQETSRGLLVQPPPSPGALDVMELDEELAVLLPDLNLEPDGEIEEA